MIKELGAIDGRTFIVGDLHGCFNLLTTELAMVDFDPSNDRVICTGDLVDRGTQNMECLRLLNEPWFYSVRGNHDDLMLFGLQGDSAYRNCWLNNGGGWVFTLDQEEQYELRYELLPKVAELPYVIRTGDVAVLHAECTLESLDILDDSDTQMLTWGRSTIRSGLGGIVGGAKHIVVGHSVVGAPIRLGNHVFIDTGAVFGGSCTRGEGRLTLINIDDLDNILHD